MSQGRRLIWIVAVTSSIVVAGFSSHSFATDAEGVMSSGERIPLAKAGFRPVLSKSSIHTGVYLVSPPRRLVTDGKIALLNGDEIVFNASIRESLLMEERRLNIDSVQISARLQTHGLDGKLRVLAVSTAFSASHPLNGQGFVSASMELREAIRQ